MKDRSKLIIFALSLLLLLAAPLAVAPVSAQQPDQPNEATQGPPVDDPIRELNLTPEQREQIRAIRQQNQEERVSINGQLRNANRALQEALDADNPDEPVIEQLLRQVAQFQGAQMRLRVLTEVRIRRVLTPEQRTLLRNFRLSRQMRRNPQNPRRDALDNPRRFPNQRNGLDRVRPRP